MKKGKQPIQEYDFTGGVRGKYVSRIARGVVVVLDRDVAKTFGDSKSVNEALRALVRIIRRVKRRIK